VPRITISYRRDDSLDITGRIYDQLASHFGRDAVFRDIDNIPLGADFRRHIDQVLDESDIILAIVGPRWVGPRANQSRLARANDPVRLEIETALRKGKPLIPVLVMRAVMPRPEQLPETMHDFVYRNAVEIDSGRDFDTHIRRLTRAMDQMLGLETHGKAVGEGMAAGTAAAVQAGSTDPFLDRGMPAKPELEVEIEELPEASQNLEKQLRSPDLPRDVVPNAFLERLRRGR
jgi:hypothetical protein